MRAVDQTQGLLLPVLLLLLQLSLVGCQGVGVEADPWVVAEWGICEPLSNPEVSIRSRGIALSEDARAQLETLKALMPSESKASVVSLNALPRNRWTGYISLDRQGYPLPLTFELNSHEGKSWVQEFPHLDHTQKLAALVDQLPLLNDAPAWEGGFIGRDSRGRLLSPVVLVWLPPLVYIDGHPLEGEASQKKITERLKHAFAARGALASAAQSSYTPHVAIAISGDQSAQVLNQLMTWSELSGADQVSLITQTSQKTATLFYLAARGSIYALLSPQRHLRAHLKVGEVTLDVKRTDQSKAEELGDQLKLLDAVSEDQAREREALETLSSLLSRSRTKSPLTGVVLQLDERARVHDVTSISRLIRTLDPSLPITLIDQSLGQRGEE